MKGLKTPNGLEAETNDGNIKYILRKVTNFPREGMEQTVYTSSVFVREQGNSWVQSVNSGSSYLSLNDFVQSISRVPELSQAYRELTQETHDNGR